MEKVSMNTADPQYQTLLGKLVTKMRLAQVNSEAIREDRTKVGTVSLFGPQMRFDLSKGFPILTSKKVHFKSIVTELLWFLKGDTNIKYLLENGCTIWTEWRYKAYLQDHAKRATANSPKPLSMAEFEKLLVDDPTIAEAYGDIGKGYGHQWRNFGEQYSEYDDDYGEVTKTGFDQISWVINEIKSNPTSRRLIVSGWNPHEVTEVDLPPCHTLFQFFVEKRSNEEMIKDWEFKRNRTFKSHYDKDVWKSLPGFQGYLEALMVTEGIPTSKLSCQLYQRSADIFLGVPFNIASYALLTHIIAQECNLSVGEFVWTGGDVHLYSNHIEQAAEQELRSYFDLPKLAPFPTKALEDYEPDDFKLIGYNHHPAIKAPVAV